MRVYLLGYMGSGKSTVGRKLASRLGFEFLDLDAEVERLKGCSVSAIFNAEGEMGFREAEKNCLYATLALKNVVVSTGGGTPCFFENMKWMKEMGTTVYLQMNAGSLYHRLGPGKMKRPLLSKLSDIDLIEFISNQLREREPYYLQSAHVMNGQNIKIDELIHQIKVETKT